MDRLTKSYENDDQAKDLFKTLTPILFGVATKLALARTDALKRLDELNEIKYTRLKGLEELSGFGMTVKGVTSRVAGIVAGGGIGGAIAFSRITSNVEGATIAAVLLGIAAGYLAIELGLWRYKVKKRPEIIEETKKNKRNYGIKCLLWKHMLPLLCCTENLYKSQAIYTLQRVGELGIRLGNLQ